MCASPATAEAHSIRLWIATLSISNEPHPSASSWEGGSFTSANIKGESRVIPNCSLWQATLLHLQLLLKIRCHAEVPTLMSYRDPRRCLLHPSQGTTELRAKFTLSVAAGNFRVHSWNRGRREIRRRDNSGTWYRRTKATFPSSNIATHSELPRLPGRATQ